MSATDPLDQALRRLHLPAVRQQYPELAAQAVAENWSYPEYLERLAQAELVRRQERRLAQTTRRAGFPFLKTLEELDFTFQQSLQRHTGPFSIADGAELPLCPRNFRDKKDPTVTRALQRGDPLLGRHVAQLPVAQRKRIPDGTVEAQLVRGGL